MRLRTRAALVLGGAATVVLVGAPSYAHDCYNPTKDAHAPTAGVNYEITGFGPDGPIFEQIGPGQGIGGFVYLAPDSIFPGFPGGYVHSIGNSTTKDEVGGPGSMTADHACDGKGIDYLDDCLGG